MTCDWADGASQTEELQSCQRISRIELKVKTLKNCLTDAVSVEPNIPRLPWACPEYPGRVVDFNERV